MMMKKPLMKIDVITTFPDMFSGLLGESMLARGQEQGIVAIEVHDLRDFTDDVHRTVDDTPFGGGGGMILKAEPIVRELQAAGHQRLRMLFGGLELYQFALDPEVVGKETYLTSLNRD